MPVPRMQYRYREQAAVREEAITGTVRVPLRLEPPPGLPFSRVSRGRVALTSLILSTGLATPALQGRPLRAGLNTGPISASSSGRGIFCIACDPVAVQVDGIQDDLGQSASSGADSGSTTRLQV